MESPTDSQVMDAIESDLNVEDFAIPLLFIENGRDVIKLLSKEPHPSKAGKKLIPDSYGRGEWVTLTAYQTKQAIKAYHGLSMPRKDFVDITIANLKSSRLGSKSVDNAERMASNTNKHDIARMLHIFVDPQFSNIWTGVHQVKDRVSMDDKEHDPDYWGQLAAEFNNYERNYYENITCSYVIDENTFTTSKCGPGFGHESSWDLCKDIEPTLGTSRRLLRDGAWIKEQYRLFKSSWILIYNNFKASGHQDAEYAEGEFNNYIGGRVIYLYAFVLFKETDMTLVNALIGKTLPEHASNDTGVLGDNSEFKTPKSLKTCKAYNKIQHSVESTASRNKIIVEHTMSSPGSNLSTSALDSNIDDSTKRIAEEKDEADFNIMILKDEKLHVNDMHVEAAKALKDIQAARRQRREAYNL